MAKRIAVYADWNGLPDPLRLGFLHVHPGARHEIFEYEYDSAVLAHPHLINLRIDPRLGLYPGRQHPAQTSHVFGVFADASPDRWGRMLMQRRLEREQRAGVVDKNVRLHESDFLLGVHDAYRLGALRFKLNDSGEFLDNRHDMAAPPFVQLRELEAASRALEREPNNVSQQIDEWLRLLIIPGGSLGGARPKASVVDPQGRLWIAKFPSEQDTHNVGAWELLVQTLAKRCGLHVPPCRAQCYASKQHTFLVQRFDRTATNRRLHFASAMTLTGHHDGDDAATGVSYLDIARVLIDQGAQTNIDLRELWSRIVFNMLVSNTDDHLRNHGFILVPGKGWQLSAAYDMNPVPDAQSLKLNVSAADNAKDLDLALDVAPYFRVDLATSREIINRFRGIVKQWPKIANAIGISSAEQARMASAFLLAE